MKIKKVACALLVRGDQILLQDRTGISKYGEEWSFFGGGIEEGETPEIALLREMQEELHLDISSWKRRYLGEIVHYSSNMNLEYHRFLFGIQVPNNHEIFQDYEGAGAHWKNILWIDKLKFNTTIVSEKDQLLRYFSTDTYL